MSYESWLSLIYENPAGRATLPHLVKRKFLSRLYGMYCQTGHSAKKIPQFVEDYQVDMTGCEPYDSYKNFSEFFARERAGITFPEKQNQLGSPCEGLVSTYSDILPEKLIAAKGCHFSLTELLGDEALAEKYRGGMMIKIRLTPADYHRIHFFDDGMVSGIRFIDGDLFSVNPMAVKKIARLYCRNKRAVIMFSSQNFGDVVIVEVGATFVGSIIHKVTENDRIKRGQLAGYFLPGGSLVMIFLRQGAYVLKTSTETRTRVGATL